MTNSTLMTSWFGLIFEQSSKHNHQVIAGVRIARFRSDGPTKVPRRFLNGPLGEQRHAETVVGQCVIGVERQSPLQTVDRSA